MQDLDSELFLAAGHRDGLEDVKKLIEKGANPNKLYTGQIANTLMNAAFWGKIETLKYLYEKGARIDVKGDCRESALLLAVQQGHLEVVHFLVEKGIDINAKTYGDDSALLSAACCLTHCYDPKYVSTTNYFDHLNYSVKINNYLNITKFLIEKGATFSESDKSIFLVKTQFAKKENVEFVLKFLVDTRAAMECVNEPSVTEHKTQENIEYQKQLYQAQQEAAYQRQFREQLERQLKLSEEKENKVKEELTKIKELKQSLPLNLKAALEEGRYTAASSEEGLLISYVPSQSATSSKNALRTLKNQLRNTPWIKDIRMENDTLLVETGNPEASESLQKGLEDILFIIPDVKNLVLN